jgi:Ca2+-transporting ATPase
VPPVAWHALDAAEVAARLGSDLSAGLAEAEAAARLARHGPNALPVAAPVRWPRVLGRQLASPLVAILAAAAVLSAAAGAATDAGVIVAILVLNALLGFAQEWRAERALAALRQMLAHTTTVVRAGAPRRIDARELVPGDRVRLAAGDRVPADLRLLEARELRADESALTGESSPVSKRLDAVAADAPLAERRACVFAGTAITSGGGSGIAVATGIDTELGRIARLARAVGDERTPLQRRLASLGAQLGILAVAVAALTALAGWLLGRAPLEMLLTGVALAVAVVPEGLPAVVTISLALGARAMARRRALVRRLQAAETLGSASVICTDKTGTLTQNAMTMRAVWLAAGELEVEGAGYAPEGGFRAGGVRVAPESRADLLALLQTGVACSHAALRLDDTGEWRAVGDPTEAALLVAARKAGLKERTGDALHELPFDSARKRMTRVIADAGARVAHVKGAPELLLPRCAAIRDADAERPLTERDREAALRAWQRFAAAGLRTLALARRVLPPDLEPGPETLERELVLLGVVGILDPPRPEVPEAVAEARAAGIRVVMLTGDAAPTALSIAAQIGLPAERAVTGGELDALSDAGLAQAVAEGAVFARTTPEQKLRLVDVLRARGEVVAMTGDGVNDAPALERADIGVAMGIRGTDVARGAADMVLTDDNFASIVHAVEAGRRQVDNLRKFVRYLLSANLGEATAIIANVLLGGPLILLPVQILWINLVTDGVTAVALALEPLEAGAMRRPPRPVREPLLDRRGWLAVLGIGGWIGLAVLVLFQQALDGGDEARARTLAFTGLVVLEKAAVLGFRSLHAPLSVVGWGSNPWLLAAIASMLALQAAAVHVPWLGALLHTTPLSPRDWLLLVALALPAPILGEAWKRATWRRAPRR